MPGPIAASVAPNRLGAGGDDAGGQTAPAAVQHRHAVRPRERDRQAVGGEDQRRQAGLGDDVAVDLGDRAPRPRERARLLRRGVESELGAVDLETDRDALRLEAERGRQASPVRDHGIVPVLGEDAEVEAVEGSRADTSGPGGEGGSRPAQLGLQPPHPVVLSPVHAPN